MDGELWTDTAARELEEESHWLLPAAVTAPLLQHCPSCFAGEAGYVAALLRLENASELPALMEARLAGAHVDPCASLYHALRQTPRPRRGVPRPWHGYLPRATVAATSRAGRRAAANRACLCACACECWADGPHVHTQAHATTLQAATDTHKQPRSWVLIGSRWRPLAAGRSCAILL